MATQKQYSQGIAAVSMFCLELEKVFEKYDLSLTGIMNTCPSRDFTFMSTELHLRLNTIKFRECNPRLFPQEIDTD
jgi:hypothetical protein